jgi:hypothetical protein
MYLNHLRSMNMFAISIVKNLGVVEKEIDLVKWCGKKELIESMKLGFEFKEYMKARWEIILGQMEEIDAEELEKRP